MDLSENQKLPQEAQVVFTESAPAMRPETKEQERARLLASPYWNSEKYRVFKERRDRQIGSIALGNEDFFGRFRS